MTKLLKYQPKKNGLMRFAAHFVKNCLQARTKRVLADWLDEELSKCDLPRQG